jgi:transcriptional regulator with XRE-family HTH domain
MDRDPIIDTLHGARLERGMTQQQLADQAGVHRMLVTDWETDRRLPRLDRLRRWADALGFDLVLVKREDG